MPLLQAIHLPWSPVKLSSGFLLSPLWSIFIYETKTYTGDPLSSPVRIKLLKLAVNQAR